MHRQTAKKVPSGGKPMSQALPTITEQQVLEALRRVPAERWGEVLQFLRDLEEGVRLAAEFDPTQPLARAYTPRQLTLLPPDSRNAVLEASALLAEDIYLRGAMNEDGYGQSSPHPTDAR
jgi:hypothetical protein